MTEQSDLECMASLQAAKQRLRLAMKPRLEGLSMAAVSSQSDMVLDSLKGFKPYIDARHISVFLSMPGGEIQTDAIVRHAIASGKEVFVPYLHKNPQQPEHKPARVMDMVRLQGLADYEALKPDRWGIPSIDAGTVHERQRILGGPDAHGSSSAVLDLILMPGVAFEVKQPDGEAREIRRLGHGKGFYDYFIHRYRLKVEGLDGGKPSTLLYALALKEQLVSDGSVPVGPLDQRLDGLILGNGEITQAKTKGPKAA